MEQWETLLDGPAKALAGHLTLDRVTANRSGEEITVCFSSDVLVEEGPFLAVQRALRRNFMPIRVHLVIRSPQLADDFRQEPQKYAAFILRSIKRKHPSGAPFLQPFTVAAPRQRRLRGTLPLVGCRDRAERLQ